MNLLTFYHVSLFVMERQWWRHGHAAHGIDHLFQTTHVQENVVVDGNVDEMFDRLNGRFWTVEWKGGVDFFVVLLTAVDVDQGVPRDTGQLGRLFLWINRRDDHGVGPSDVMTTQGPGIGSQ